MTLFTTRRALVAATLGAPLFVRHALAADEPRFALGVASGHPRADGMVLWTRLTGDELPERVDVRWEVAADEHFKRIVAHGTDVAEAAWAHTIHAEPAGLQPARWYWYRFTALGQRSAAGRTRTAPAADSAVDTLRFCIASCQRWDHGHYAAWRHAAAQNFDLVLFLGDYIYEYPSPPGVIRRHEGLAVRTLDQYRARYAQYKGDPSLQAAHAAAPWLMVWDDHEVENDYAAGTPPLPDPFFAHRRAAATQAYWEHLPFPKAMRPRGTEMRLYGRVDWGRLARIHLLDDRQYRDPHVCPKPLRRGANAVTLADCPELIDPRRSLLGMPQEQWLAESWSRERSWNLVGQQTLMARAIRDEPKQGVIHWTDGWDGYAPARKRLLDVVAERNVPGVVVLGGDVHAHYVTDLKADFDNAAARTIATEFCGTSISSRGMDQSIVDRIRSYNPHIRHAQSDRRGYVGFALQPDRLDASLFAVADSAAPASAVNVAASYTVDARQPGAQPT